MQLGTMMAHQSFFLFHYLCIITTCSTTHQPTCCCQCDTCCTVLFVRCHLATAVLDEILSAMAYAVAQCATRLAKLQQLQLSSCAALTLTGVRGFPALTSLDLSRCEALLSAAAVSLTHILTWLRAAPETGP